MADDEADGLSPDQLRVLLIEEINRNAMLDKMTPHELAEYREMRPKVKALVDWVSTVQRVLKAIGALLLGGTGILAIMQAIDKFREWIGK